MPHGVSKRAVQRGKPDGVPRQVGEDPLQQKEVVLMYGRTACLDRGN